MKESKLKATVDSYFDLVVSRQRGVANNGWPIIH